MGVAGIVAIGVPFVWLGMVVAISVLEAPLKFRAPGITLALGLGIGRIVFRALGVAELALAAALTAVLASAVTVGGPRVGAVAGMLLGSLWLMLLVQIGLLRPRLDRRAVRVLAGDNPPRSMLHLVYITLEAVKVVVLLALGSSLITGFTA
ncbi:hypothetical protein [Mycolicibacterium sp.]|uniref:hypothetical protein n=1 Tax=Mycolicibacterium sp. TaxID=2320850 RepID=UPI003D0F8ECB